MCVECLIGKQNKPILLKVTGDGAPLLLQENRCFLVRGKALEVASFFFLPVDARRALGPAPENSPAAGTA